MSQTLDVDRIRELLLDVYQAHRDPQDHDSDWQQAEDVPCAWCDGAKIVLEQIKRLRSAHVPAPQGEQEPQTMADAAEMLWVVLANVSGGDWTKQTAEWQEAAARWRDNYLAVLESASAPLLAPTQGKDYNDPATWAKAVPLPAPTPEITGISASYNVTPLPAPTAEQENP